jgi:glucose-1-phosphate thymidylyltransferase
MLEANRQILETIEPKIDGDVDSTSTIHGRVVVGKGSKVVGSVIRGPAIIGEGCTIENAYVGPFTSIYNRVTIAGSEIEHSIVLEDSCIKDIGSRVEDSLIGKNVVVSKDDGRPRAYRLMLGDNSNVSVI